MPVAVSGCEFTMSTSSRTALEAKFTELSSQLRRLSDALAVVRLTASEDRPRQGDSAIADQLEDATLDLMGLLHQAQEAIRAAQRHKGDRIDSSHAKRALNTCQGCIQKIEKQFWADLSSHERLNALAQLGTERRGEWIPWTAAVNQAIEQCRQPLGGVGESLAACWQSLSSRLG